MNLRPRHLAAGHVQRQHLDQTVAADPATHLHRRSLRQARWQPLDPALADADAGVSLLRLALQHLDADALLVLDTRVVDAAGGGRQLRVLRDQDVVDALLLLPRLDAETVSVDIDLD